MSREIRIPFQDPLSPDDAILDVVTWARKSLKGEELRVVEQLVRDALEQRCVTHAAELFEELESAGPDGRRQGEDLLTRVHMTLSFLPRTVARLIAWTGHSLPSALPSAPLLLRNYPDAEVACIGNHRARH